MERGAGDNNNNRGFLSMRKSRSADDQADAGARVAVFEQQALRAASPEDRSGDRLVTPFGQPPGVLVAPSEVEAEGHARKIVQVLSLFIRYHAILDKRMSNLLIRYCLLVKKPLRIDGLHGCVSTMFPSERGLHILPPRIRVSAPAGQTAT